MVEKLQKLIAMERSARTIGNLAEAEAFASKIQELLFEHGLSMSEVEIQEQEKDEQVDRAFVRDIVSGGRCAWLETLSGAVASSCFCRRHVVPGRSAQVFIGRTSDREAAVTLLQMLSSTALDLARKAAKEKVFDRAMYYEDEIPRERSNFRKSFLHGFADAIDSRLNVGRHQLEGVEGGSALVLRKDAAIQEFIGDKVKVARSTFSGPSDSGGYRLGYKAGQGASVSARKQLKPA